MRPIHIITFSSPLGESFLKVKLTYDVRLTQTEFPSPLGESVLKECRPKPLRGKARIAVFRGLI